MSSRYKIFNTCSTLKKLFFVLLFLTFSFYCAGLTIKVSEYIYLKKENKILIKDLKEILRDINHYSYTNGLLDNKVELIKEENKIYIEEYQRWEKWNQEIIEYLK